MRIINLKNFLVGAGFLGVLFFGSAAYAADAGVLQGAFDQLGHAAGQSGAQYGQAADPRLIAANIVKAALTLVATIIFVLIAYAGFRWMTAGGNEDQIAQAKQTIFNSTIGLIIILSAYGITILVTNLALGNSLGTTSSQIQAPTGP